MPYWSFLRKKTHFEIFLVACKQQFNCAYPMIQNSENLCIYKRKYKDKLIANYKE